MQQKSKSLNSETSSPDQAVTSLSSSLKDINENDLFGQTDVDLSAKNIQSLPLPNYGHNTIPPTSFKNSTEKKRRFGLAVAVMAALEHLVPVKKKYNLDRVEPSEKGCNIGRFGR